MSYLRGCRPKNLSSSGIGKQSNHSCKKTRKYNYHADPETSSSPFDVNQACDSPNEEYSTEYNCDYGACALDPPSGEVEDLTVFLLMVVLAFFLMGLVIMVIFYDDFYYSSFDPGAFEHLL